MARAGITVTGSSGNLQIDDTFLNYRMVAEGSKPLSKFNSSTNTVPANNTVVYSGGPNPILMAKVSSIFVAVSGKSFSGSTTTWELATDTSGTFNYVIFDTQPPLPSNFGLQLYGPDGGLVFDAVNSKLLRVYNILSGTSASLPAGRTFAAALNHTLLAFDTYFPGGGDEWTQMLGSSIKLSATSVARSWETLQIIPDNPANFVSQEQFYNSATTNNLRFIVADISGY